MVAGANRWQRAPSDMDGAGTILPDSGQAVGGARIGPNAILQLIAVLDREEGRVTRDLIVTSAGVAVPPPDSGMIPETDAARLHLAVRQVLPDRADGILRQAGLATGEYILRHRIPRAAQWLIRALPAPLAARVLSAAIARHAWTFAGSGSFRIRRGRMLVFEVVNNPLAMGLTAAHPLCDWHAAVFERLFSRLVWPGCQVHEVACIAKGDPACLFQIRKAG